MTLRAAHRRRVCAVDIFGALVTLAILSNSSGQACTCTPMEPACQAYGTATAIFAGEVTGILPGPSWSSRSRVVRLKVMKSFKGTGQATTTTIEVKTGFGGGDCGYGFRKGEQYLVYAFRRLPGEVLEVNSCGRTRRLSEAGDDLAYIENLPRAASGATILGSVLESIVDFSSRLGEFENRPVNNVKIAIEGQGRSIAARTGSDGRYRVTGLTPGKYHVRADLAAETSRFSEMDLEIQDRGCAETAFRVEHHGRIYGKVTHADGRAATTAKVDLVLASDLNSTHPKGTTSHSMSEHGEFRFELLPRGEYVLGVNIRGDSGCGEPQVYYPTGSTRATAKRIRLNEGELVEGVQLQVPQLPELLPLVEGVVVWPNGIPAAGVQVHLEALGCSWIRRVGATRTDSRGRFTASAEPGRRYRVFARIEAGGRDSGGVFQSHWMHAEPAVVTATRDLPPSRLVLSSEGVWCENDFRSK